MQTDTQSANLTEKRIRDAKPRPNTRIMWDAEVRGLGVRITPAGVKSYVLNYRVDGRMRRATLARAADISLAAARERAGRELTAIRNGEADPLRRRQAALKAPTVNEGLDRFFGGFVQRRMADGLMAPRTVRDYRNQADRTVRPALGAMKIASVTRHDIEDAVAKRGPVQRNRTVAFLSRLFNTFEDWEYRTPNSNPARRIEKTREQPRDRVLAPSEIQALGAALDRMGDPFIAGAVRFLLFTGWRTGETLSLQWDHVDFETATITLPSTKTGRDVRSVGSLALELLAGVDRVNGNPHVFASGRDRAVSYATLRRAFLSVCRQAGIDNIRLQDIRRSVATSAAAHGMSVFMLRDLLNHKTVTMASRYARRADSALQEAQNVTAGRMAALLDGMAGEVLPLRGRKVT